MFAVILGAFCDPFVGFAVLKQLYLDLCSGIAFAPFDLIGLSGGPFLTAVEGGDCK